MSETMSTTKTAVNKTAGLASPVAETPYTARARYFNSGNAFGIKYPPVPRHVFVAERDHAFAPDTPTSLIDLDLSGALELPFPATTPLILARYARIRAGESLSTAFRASGEACYVIQGAGHTQDGDSEMHWQAGDALFLPGGQSWTHTADAGSDDTVLWIVTDEPQLAFQGVEPTASSNAQASGPVHFPGARIESELEALYASPNAENMPGFAVVFSTDWMEAKRNIHPTMTFAMNSLPPGQVQRAHHHNSVAVTLCVRGEGGYSVTSGERIDWSRHVVFVTPPGEDHAHFNDGTEQARFLIVQDGGLHYHCRTMDFDYVD